MGYVPKVKSRKKFITVYNLLYKHFGAQQWWPGDSPFEVMVGAILAQNTNWYNVARAIDNLKKARVLTPDKLLNSYKKLEQLIRPAGFYRLKSKRLLSFVKYFMAQYQGDVVKMKVQPTPVLRAELLAIKGIGKETADSILLYALEKPVFVIDAYTRRIFARHKFFPYELPYDKIKCKFEQAIRPEVKIYNEYHALLVKLGKEYCRKNEPRCDHCPLYNI